MPELKNKKDISINLDKINSFIISVLYISKGILYQYPWWWKEIIVLLEKFYTCT